MKKLSSLLTNFSLVATAFLMTPVKVLAAGETANQVSLKVTGDFAPLGDITFASLVSGGIRLILVLAAVIFFFVLVIGGIQWILSGGDKAGAETARKRITAALVGLAIVFVAWAIGTLVNSLFGINIFTLNLPNLQPPK